MQNQDTEKSVTRRNLLTGLASLTASLAGLAGLAQGAKNPASTKIVKWDDKFEVAVDFEIVQSDAFRYHRPYVAVWLEDSTGKSVRTLSLWVQTSRRGPRWIPDGGRYPCDPAAYETGDLIFPDRWSVLSRRAGIYRAENTLPRSCWWSVAVLWLAFCGRERSKDRMR